MYDKQEVYRDGGASTSSMLIGKALAHQATSASDGIGNPYPSVPKTQAEIAESLAIQEKTTHALTEIVAALGARLSPVLMPIPNGDNGRLAREYGSQIARCVGENTCRIDSAISQISGLLERLAV
jgi:hypothetical protein